MDTICCAVCEITSVCSVLSLNMNVFNELIKAEVCRANIQLLVVKSWNLWRGDVLFYPFKQKLEHNISLPS